MQKTKSKQVQLIDCCNTKCLKQTTVEKPFCVACLKRLPDTLRGQIKMTYDPTGGHSLSDWGRVSYLVLEWLNRNLPLLTGTQQAALTAAFHAQKPVPFANNIYPTHTVDVLLRSGLLKKTEDEKIQLTPKGCEVSRLLLGENVWRWEDWVPQSLRDEIEKFWGVDLSRSPLDREKSRDSHNAPPDGTRVSYINDQDERLTGRYVHAFNNMGRIVGENGSVKVCCCSLKEFKIVESKDNGLLPTSCG